MNYKFFNIYYWRIQKIALYLKFIGPFGLVDLIFLFFSFRFVLDFWNRRKWERYIGIRIGFLIFFYIFLVTTQRVGFHSVLYNLGMLLLEGCNFTDSLWIAILDYSLDGFLFLFLKKFIKIGIYPIWDCFLL